MVRLILFRLLLVVLPLALWLLWAEYARRRGKPVGATPYGWLITGGIALAVASLAVTAVLDPEDPARQYVPETLEP